jgi:hypothetical protein
MEFKMYMDAFNIGEVVFDLNNVPFKKENLMMLRLAGNYRIQILYIKDI